MEKAVMFEHNHNPKNLSVKKEEKKKRTPPENKQNKNCHAQQEREPESGVREDTHFRRSLWHFSVLPPAS